MEIRDILAREMSAEITIRIRTPRNVMRFVQATVEDHDQFILDLG